MSGFSSRIALASVLTTTLLLTGCNDPPVRDPGHPSRPATFLPEQFPDIPLPPGYMLSPDSDQLAVSLAGGSVRRFEVSLERRPNTSPQTPAALLGYVKRDLMDHDWTLTGSDEASQHWHKGNEDLLVETGRTDSRTTIRYRMRPAVTSTP